jgi:hypothetical protein
MLGSSISFAIRSGGSSPNWRQWLSTGDATRFQGFEDTLYKTQLLIDPSLYWKQLSEYRRYFADNQIKVGFFEDFIANERAELQAYLSFLGVDPFIDIDINDDDDRNSSEGKRQRLAVVDAFRALPGYERVKRFIPQSLKTLFTDRINRPIPTTSPWTAESVEWTVSRVADDSCCPASNMRGAARTTGRCGEPAQGTDVLAHAGITFSNAPPVESLCVPISGRGQGGRRSAEQPAGSTRLDAFERRQTLAPFGCDGSHKTWTMDSVSTPCQSDLGCGSV